MLAICFAKFVQNVELRDWGRPEKQEPKYKRSRDRPIHRGAQGGHEQLGGSRKIRKFEKLYWHLSGAYKASELGAWEHDECGLVGVRRSSLAKRRSAKCEG